VVSSLCYVSARIADRLVSRVQESALEGRKPVAPTGTLTTRNSPGVKYGGGVTLTFGLARTNRLSTGSFRNIFSKNRKSNRRLSELFGKEP